MPYGAFAGSANKGILRIRIAGWGKRTTASASANLYVRKAISEFR